MEEERSIYDQEWAQRGKFKKKNLWDCLLIKETRRFHGEKKSDLLKEGNMNTRTFCDKHKRISLSDVGIHGLALDPFERKEDIKN